MASWQSYLQTASYKGYPFGVLTSNIDMPERTQIHEYPFKSIPYVEGLGSGPQTFSFQGYLCGDSCLDQLYALTPVWRSSTPGWLTHPIWGTIWCNITAFSVATNSNTGAYVSMSLSFVATDPNPSSIGPMTNTDTSATIQNNSAELNDSAGNDYINSSGTTYA